MESTMAFNPGAILGSGLSFIGGLMQQGQAASQFGAQMALSREQMNRDNTRFWDQWNQSQWATDRSEQFTRERQDWSANMNANLMREQYWLQRQAQEAFAQHGIRWKVEDAKRAGLHPLFALGGGSSFSPVNMSPVAESGSAPMASVGAGMGQSALPSGQSINPFSDVGQDLSRAIMATQTKREREEDVVSDLSRRHIESQIALNNARASEISRSAMNGQIGPAMPNSAGVQRAGANHTPQDSVEVKPAENTSTSSLNVASQAGQNPSGRVIDYPYSVAVLPAKELNIDEATSPGGGTHHVNYSLLPMLGSKPTADVIARAKQRWPNAVGLDYVPFMGWVPRYQDDMLARASRWLVPGRGHKGNLGHPLK